MINKNHIKKLKEVAELEEKYHPNPITSFAFIVEEVGELSKDLTDRNYSHAKQEALDIAIAALGTYYRLGGSDSAGARHITKQIKKWKRNLTGKA